MLLELEGAHVDIVHEGRRAVGFVAHAHPDVVVLDVGLKDIDGVVVARALRLAWPELPIIFATGRTNRADLRAIASDRRTEVLEKPYEIETLIATIEAVTQGT